MTTDKSLLLSISEEDSPLSLKTYQRGRGLALQVAASNTSSPLGGYVVGIGGGLVVSCCCRVGGYAVVINGRLVVGRCSVGWDGGQNDCP